MKLRDLAAIIGAEEKKAPTIRSRLISEILETTADPE